MRDVLAALVKMIEEGDGMTPESRTAVDRLLKRVDLAGREHEPASLIQSSSTTEFSNSLRKREDGGILKFLKTERATGVLETDNTPVENEKALSQLNRYALTDTDNRQQNEDSLFHLKNAGLKSDTDTGIETKQGVKEEGPRVKAEIKSAHESPLMNRSPLSELIHTVKQTETPSKDVLPAYLIDQVGKQISRSILNGDQVIRLKLKPPGLGSLRIEMDIKGNMLKLKMTTENHSTRDILLSNVHELREALGEQGVKLERIDIQIDHDFDRSFANFKEGLKEGQDQSQGFANEQLWADDDQGDNESKPLEKNVSDRLLDLVA